MSDRPTTSPCHGPSNAAGQPFIREATEADVDALINLHLEALQAHPDAFAADPQQTAADRVSWTGRLKRNLSTNMGTVCLAATPSGLVGMSGIFRRSLAKMQHTATIWGMYVQPAWRRQGLASRLLEANLSWARKQHLCVVYLSVVASNLSAIRCYQRHGFSVYGVEPNALLYNGHYYDELLMAYSI